MPRSNVTIRKAPIGAPTATTTPAGVVASAALGAINRIASPRRVPTGISAAGIVGALIGITPESLLTFSNRSITEGDSGSTNLTFPLTRAADGYPTIAFDYETIDGSAVAGVDYTATSGSGTVASGGTFNINVPIIGDTDEESDENFSVRVFNLRFL